MKLKLLCGVANVAALFSSALMMAQNYQTMTIQSGFTADVIANGVGPALSSTTSDVDGVSYAFISKDFQATSSSAVLTYGLPINGTVNSVAASTPGLVYQLADYNAGNSLKLSNTNDSGTLVFATPKAAFRLYMLATSGSGASTVSAVVNFMDNTSQTITGITVSDWYNASGFAIQGFGRINRNTDALESGSGTNPRLYQAVLNIDAANQSKPIQSITITKTSTAQGHANIFAFSADAYSDCAAPTLQPVGTLSSNSAAVSWTVPAGTTAASYDLYYSTTNTAPTGATVPSIPGITSTSYTIGGLQPTTTYYYWVRTNCNNSTGQSVWSFAGTFTTLCGAMVPSYTNAFNPFPGSCWALNLTGGDATTGPAGTGTALWIQDGFLNNGTTGAARINLYSTNRKGWMKTVPFDLSAGGYRVKFDYGITTYSGTAASAMGSDDIIQFLVSSNGGATWTVLQTWDATNTPSNTLNTYTYDLANFVNANTVFAFYGSDGTVDDAPDYNFYVDNFTVESLQLSTSEAAVKKTVAVHPNPFKDILYISDSEKVASLTVSDVSGRLIKTIDRPAKEIELSFLNSGLYLVTFRLKDGSQYTVKAVKQ